MNTSALERRIMAENWQKIKISLRKNKTAAYMKVPSLIPKNPLKIEDALKAMEQAGVIKGIKRDMLEKLFKQKLFDQELLIAQNIAPKNGTDGRIEFFFDVERKLWPRVAQDDQVDYKKVSVVNNVSKGEKLCRRHPPSEGEPGETVTGKLIAPKPGRDEPLPQGPNTKPSPDDPNLLISCLEGHVFLNRSNLVEVQPGLEIKGDVDYSTGNIQFKGSVRVHGDIKSGFEVKAGGDLDIDGCVEDAMIRADGDVLIKKGFIGRGKGSIQAGGNVTVGYVKSQKINCSGNLNISGEFLYSKAVVDKDILLHREKGIIIGGVIEAGGSIEASKIGNSQFVTTKVVAGSKEKLRENLSKIEKQIKKIEENQRIMQETMQSLFQLKTKYRGKLPAEKKNLLKKVQRSKLHFFNRHRTLNEERTRLLKKINEKKGSHIKIYQSIFPGVEMYIGLSQRSFIKRFAKKIFREKNGKIVVDSLKTS